MLIRAYLSFVLIAAAPAFCQVAPPGGIFSGEESAPMTAPPPVSGQPYSFLSESEARANYLSAGVRYSAGYIDNVFPGGALHSRGDEVHSIWPMIALDQTTSRQHLDLTYRPGYTFYAHTSELNEMDQALTARFRYHLTPHLTLRAADTFAKSQGILFQSGSLLEPGVSPSGPLAASGAIAPYADQINNAVSGGFDLQTGRNSMIGGSGSYWFLSYPHPSQAPGLYDSTSRSGSAFYTARVSDSQYVGARYQGAQMDARPVGMQSETTTHTLTLFYTFEPREDFSFSVAAGPQRYAVSQTGLAGTSSWAPSVITSLGWRTPHSSFATRYAHEVTGGGGLLGAFRSDSAELAARWLTSPNWALSASAAYILNKSVTPAAYLATPGGHTVAGSASIDRRIRDPLRVKLEYIHLHQSYASIPAISSNPDSNSVMITVSWQLSRPLGR